MRKWLTSLPARIAEGAIVLIIGLAITDHYYDHIRLNTRTWVFGLIVVGTVAVVAGITAVISRRSLPHAADPVEIDDRPEAYAEHVRQILDHLRQVIAGEIPNVSYDGFIERGILEPARDMLRQDAGSPSGVRC